MIACDAQQIGYLVKPVNLLELAANIDAIASRLTRTAADSSWIACCVVPYLPQTVACWCWFVKDWQLSSGNCLQLTTHEFMFLQQP